MPFQKGHKLATGGRREGAGRPSKAQIVEREAIAKRLEAKWDRRAEELDKATLKLALGWSEAKQDPFTGELREVWRYDSRIHQAVLDRLRPKPEPEAAKSGITVNIALAQYNPHRHPLPLHTQELPTPVLAGNGERDNSGGEGLASAERQGQDRLEFRYSLDVTPQGDILPPISNLRAGEEGNLGRNGQERVSGTGALSKPANKKQKRNRTTD